MPKLWLTNEPPQKHMRLSMVLLRMIWLVSFRFWRRVQELLSTVRKLYKSCSKRAILNYILLSEGQRSRLRLRAPDPKPMLVSIRAPVSWHIRYKVAQDRARHNFHMTNPIMSRIQRLFLVDGYGRLIQIWQRKINLTYKQLKIKCTR